MGKSQLLLQYSSLDLHMQNRIYSAKCKFQRSFKLKKIFILFVFTLLLAGCSQEQNNASANQSNKAKQPTVTTDTDAKHLLVFFINPTGGPCIMQGQILEQMAPELEGKALIRPVKTTIKDDMDLFYAYGIRALPSIILTDLEGKEIKRLPAGVHPAETVRNLLNQIPES